MGKVLHGKPQGWDASHVARSICVAVAIVALACVVGCRPTDALTETIYADWATEVDYDNPMKALENAPDRTPTANLPMLYSTDKAEDPAEEPTEIYEPDDVENAPPSDENVFDPQDEPSEESAPRAEHDNDSTGDREDTEGTEAEVGGDEGAIGEGANAAEGDADDDAESFGEAQVGGNIVGMSPTQDVVSDPEKTGAVIAFGEMANIVALLGGSEALWAADDSFLDKASDIYADGLASTRRGLWADYTSTSTTISADGFKKLRAAIAAVDEPYQPKYLVYDGSVGCPITDAQSTKLEEEYGVTTIYFFLNTVDLLKNTMGYLEKVLENFDAQERYEAYWAFHDGVLDSVNGGKAAAWSTGAISQLMSFRDGSSYADSEVMPESEAFWTLLIDGWDEGASFSADGVVSTSGLGYCTLGYAWSPASYYLQRGGVINNAAARYQATGKVFSVSKTYRRYVWQMGSYFNTLQGRGKNLCLTSSDDFGKEDADILMRAQSGVYGLGKLLGDGRFPAVIVTSASAQDALETDRDSGSGVYSPHYLAAGATANNKGYPVMGVKHAGEGGSSSLWLSYIGRESGSIDSRNGSECAADEAYSGKTKVFDVLVNPHGMYSSWVNGSVESFLETPWAYETIVQANDSRAAALNCAYGDSAAEVVQSFYRTFYGQAPSDSETARILSGGYAP